ncbi:HNH endonuclease [Neobacillus citreus]|nr:HNH endonuclease [Neobacillus citreus]MCH6265078.1 HNH endonuclease [Neobacillus citreus]
MEVGCYCKLYKTCVDCCRTLHYRNFKSRGKRKRRSFCKECGLKRKENLNKRVYRPTLKEGSEIKVKAKLSNKRTISYKVSYDKAIHLVAEGMAEIIHDNLIYKLYDRVTFRNMIFERDNYKCVYCAKPGTTIDHVIPYKFGGITSFSNCVCSCRRCNQIKSDIPLEDFLFYYEPFKEKSNITIEQYLSNAMNKLSEKIKEIEEVIKIYTVIIERNELNDLSKQIQNLERSLLNLKLQLIWQKKNRRVIGI